MLNAELVTQKFNFTDLKKTTLFTGFIIIFKGQLREIKTSGRERLRESITNEEEGERDTENERGREKIGH